MAQPSLIIGMALATGWLSKNGWRRADSHVERLHDIQAYIELAQRAEQARLDFLFRPDTLFLNTQAVAHEPGFSSLDPMVMLAVLAQATQHIGLVATASTTFNPPYVVARQLQSLNWLSQGRIGWNVVTALEGQQNFGETDMLPSEQRYAKAQEFVEVVQKLWRSYPHSALLLDRLNGRYADTQQIQPIQHQGDFFEVAGPLNVPAPDTGDIPLFQAGASDWGRNFAAQISEAIFAATPDLDAGIELRQDLKQRASALGRSPEQIRVLPGLSLYLADTRSAARHLHAETHADIDRTQLMAKVQEALGLDISQLAPDQPLTLEMFPTQTTPVRSQTHTDLLRRLIERETPTVDELLTRPEVIGSAHWRVVGTPEDAVNEIIQRYEAGAADGLIAVPGGSIDSLNLFFDEVIPRLMEKGLFRQDYQGTTLRDYITMASSQPP